MPYQPLQPLAPTWQQYNNEHHFPTYQPAVPTYQEPQRRINPRDYMQQLPTPQEIERKYERMDRASERNRWAACAKYSPFCVNMLRSLGDNSRDRQAYRCFFAPAGMP